MNPSLATRLRLGFAVLLILLVGVTVIGVGRLFQLRQDYEDRTSRAFQLETRSEQLRGVFIAERGALQAIDDNRALARRELERAKSVTDSRTLAARKLAEGDDDSAAILERRADAEADWRRGVADPAFRNRPPPRSTELRLRNAVVNADNALTARQRELRTAFRNDVRDDTRGAAIFVLAGLLLSFLAAVMVFAGLVNSMRKPVAELVSAAGGLAEGKLDTRVEAGGPVETVTLGNAFNDMASDLQDAYRRVEEARLRLAVTVESLSDGLITVDAKGSVTQMNPAAQSMFGGARPGASIEAVLGEMSPPARELRRLIGGEERDELRLTDGDRVLAMAVSPLGTENGGAVLSVRDVSERARVERLKDEFVATASHELRSPLTSVKGFAELLMLERDRLTADQRQNVEIILDSTKQLVVLVNNLLDLARSDAGRLTVDPRPTDVGPLVKRVGNLLRPRIKAKGQKLRITVDPKLGTVRLDPDRIEQVLGNLLTNAHNYTPEGGSIRLTARPVEGGLELAVSDNGPGLPPEELDNVFDRFWRADAGETQQVGGTGLGLAICKSLVELHKGRIEVESQPGKGAAFRVFLPAAPAVHRDREAVSGKRVLIVEDDWPVAEALSDGLVEAGINVDWVETGDVLEQLDGSTDADLILVDVPSGTRHFELLDRIRSHDGAAEVPLLVISIYGGGVGEGEREVAEPVEPDGLLDVVAGALSGDKRLIVACHDSRRRERIAKAFSSHGMQPRVAETADEAVALARADPFDLLLLDAELPAANAVRTAVSQGALQGAPPRIVMLDTRLDDGRPRTVALDELVDRVIGEVEAVVTARSAA